MKKVLFLPGGIGLAHVGRLIMIAKEMQNRGIMVEFGAGTQAVSILQKENLPCYPLPEFERSVYERKIKNNNFFIYTRSVIKKFVLAELELFNRVKPDVVVYDVRITAKISTQIANIPCVSVLNADMTPYYDFSKVRFPVHTTLGKFLPNRFVSLLNKKFGQNFSKRVGTQLIPALLTLEMIKFSPTLLRLGYRLSKDPYQIVLADKTLIADIPEFRPVKKLPDQVKLIGPIFWDGGSKLPGWSNKLLETDNIIYVTASGTGDNKTFLKILDFLKDSPYTVVATTGNTLHPSDVKISYPNLFLTDFLPGSFILPKSKLIIFPGGNATAYQALSFGIPQVCTPFHMDQEDNANQLERLKTGIIVSPYKNFTKKILQSAISKILKDKHYSLNAIKLKKIIERYNGKKQAADEIFRMLN